MNYSKFLILILITAFMSRCIPLETVNSVKEINAETTIYKYYDSKSQIKYLVSNDDSNLHLSFKTVHKPTIAKILRAGLTIYFDKNGRKKKDVFVRYPMGSPQGFTSITPNSGQGNQPPNDIKSLINSTSIAAEYMYFQDKKSFTTTQNSDIHLSISTQSPKELIYDLIIPFSKISVNGRADLFNLSIGIVTGKFELPSTPPGLDSQAGDRGGQGGGRPGPPQQGATSNNASYSSGDRGGKSGGAPHEGFSELSEESKIWFQVGLYR